MSTKIEGPGGPNAPKPDALSETDDPARATDVARADPAAADPAGFAQALEGAQAGQAAELIGGPDPVADIAGQLDAGAITPEEAIDQLLEAVMGEPLAADLPAGARAELRDMLAGLVRDDPYLSGLAARLGIAPAEE